MGVRVDVMWKYQTQATDLVCGYVHKQRLCLEVLLVPVQALEQVLWHIHCPAMQQEAAWSCADASGRHWFEVTQHSVPIGLHRAAAAGI